MFFLIIIVFFILKISRKNLAENIIHDEHSKQKKRAENKCNIYICWECFCVFTILDLSTESDLVQLRGKMKKLALKK